MVATVWGDLTLKVPHKAAAARVSRENWVMIRAMQTGQKARTLTAIGYALLLLLLHWSVTKQVVPPFGAESLWFYSGLVILLLTVALQEPFFTTPANSLLNASALIVAAILFPSTVGDGSGVSPRVVDTGRLALGVYALVVLAIGLGAVFTRDSTRPSASWSIWSSG